MMLAIIRDAITNNITTAKASAPITANQVEGIRPKKIQAIIFAMSVEISFFINLFFFV
jgi:hypothetical protein